MQAEMKPQSTSSEVLPPLLPPASLKNVLTGFLVDALIAIGVMLALSLVAGAAWAAMRGVQIALQSGTDLQDADAVTRAIGQMDSATLLWMTLFSTGVAALVPYFWRRRASVAERMASFTAIRRPATWGWIVLAALASLFFSGVLPTLGNWLGLAANPSNEAPLKQALVASPSFVVLFAVLLAPAYEELLFRRVLFGRLWAAGWPKLGMALSSIGFALIHEPPGLSHNTIGATVWLWLIYSLMGATFAWVYRRTDTLWAPIAAHGLNNAVAMGLLALSGGM
jgi:membrane protease YdiL (CAAX protease family)